MKLKQLFPIVSLALLFTVAIVGCGPSKAEREEAARQDSIRIADSIAQAEEEARLAAIEAARQDSLSKIEKFKESIPPFREIYLHFAMYDNKYRKMLNLEELGFTKKTKRDKMLWDGVVEIETEDDTYRLALDSDHYCEIIEKGGYECTNYIFKIVGFPDLMEQYKEEAKALKRSSDFTKYSEGPSLEIRKNEIQWVDGF